MHAFSRRELSVDASQVGDLDACRKDRISRAEESDVKVSKTHKLGRELGQAEGDAAGEGAVLTACSGFFATAIMSISSPTQA